MFAAALSPPELAVIVTDEMVGVGVGVGVLITGVLPPLPQPSSKPINTNNVITPKPSFVRLDIRSNPVNTIPIRAKPNKRPPVLVRGVDNAATEFALALIVTITLPGKALELSEEGLNSQAAFAGNPVQANLTGTSSSPLELTRTLKLAAPPANTVKELVERASARRGEFTMSLTGPDVLAAKFASPL